MTRWTDSSETKHYAVMHARYFSKLNVSILQNARYTAKKIAVGLTFMCNEESVCVKTKRFRRDSLMYAHFLIQSYLE